jgi:hypothetical protein
VGTASITWMPASRHHMAQVWVVIDPRNAVAETNESNNKAHRPVPVLRPARQEPPKAARPVIDGGAEYTADVDVTVAVAAQAESGQAAGECEISAMYLAERYFDAAAGKWVRAGESGWAPFESSYAMVLAGHPGVHYLRVWLADACGNVSPGSPLAYINYLPPVASLAAGDAHVFRQRLDAGQALTLTLAPETGDADVALWAPHGELLASSALAGSEIDTIKVVAPVGGIYQVDVVAATDSAYRLAIETGDPIAHAQPIWPAVAPAPARSMQVVAPADVPDQPEYVPAPASAQLAQEVYLPGVR